MSDSKKEIEDKETYDQIFKDIDTVLDFLFKSEKVSSFNFSFMKIFHWRPSKELEKEFEKELNSKIEDFMKKKVQAPFVEEANEEKIVENFQILWDFTDILHTWIEKVCRYSNLTFEKTPNELIYPLFGKMVCDNVTVKKALKVYITLNFLDKDKDITSIAEKLLGIFVDAGKKLEYFEDEDFQKMIQQHYERIERRKQSSSSRYQPTVNYYPENDTTHQQNAKFYKGEVESQSEGGYVDDLHKKWWGEYDMLEDRHNYIQFLFPIREAGMASIQPLTKNEAEQFQKSPEMQARLIKTYELMLDFYGLVLKDKQTGEIERNKDNWQDRYKNLSWHSHNYLRITRILKCLGICGLENLKKGLIRHYIQEVFENKELEEVKSSLIKFWLPTLRIEKELIEMEEYIEKLTGKKICRKVYDKEERTWANVCYPLDSSKSYGEGKTFYNRDDDKDPESEEYLQFERVWRRGGNNDCLMM